MSQELTAEGWELCHGLVQGRDVNVSRWTPEVVEPMDVDAVLRCSGPAPPDIEWSGSSGGPTLVELSAAYTLTPEFFAFLEDPGQAESPGPGEECSAAGYTWHVYLLSTAQGWLVTDLAIDPMVGACAPMHLLPEDVSAAMQWEVLSTQDSPG